MHPPSFFSRAEVPLIVEALPMLDAIEEALVHIRDDEEEDLPNVIRVAAHAALLLLDKYFSLTDECEVYRIAIGIVSLFFIQKILNLCYSNVSTYEA
jgi:hypothetical protein